MLQRIRSRLHGEDGFTLIELLVVILIIGILAAIAIPSFLSQKSKGEDAKLKSAVQSAQTAMETYYTDNNTYAATPANLQSIEPTLNSNDFVIYATDSGTTGSVTTSSGGASAYRVTADATPSSGRTFWIDRASSGATTRGCHVTQTSDPGGCKNVGSGNVGTW